MRRAFVIVVVAGLLAVPSATSSQTASECDATVPIEEVVPGVVGTGLTTSLGTTSSPFQAEVLGVQRDAVAPGRHLIVVELASPALTAAGGVWQGMSGSPVLVGTRLLGAVSWGFAFTPSPIVGLTPGADLLALADHPEQATFAAAA